jgi:hypothetical protein
MTVARLVADHATGPLLQRCGTNSACGCRHKDGDEDDVERRQLDAGARLLREAVAARRSDGATPARGCSAKP